jgi:hypothetical protein
MVRSLLAGTTSFAIFATTSSAFAGANVPVAPDPFDVTWKSPSKDASGSMPIGNGEVCLNVWVEDTTGDLLFYIARSDSLSEISRVLKLTRVRVHMDSSPFRGSPDFRQQLHLRDGRIEIVGGGGNLNLFVDANSNTVFLKAQLRSASKCTVTNDDWRTAARTIPSEEQGSAWSVQGAPFPLVESADQFYKAGDHSIGWYHRNQTSVVPMLWENQSLTGLKGTHDPLLLRTFGGCISSPELAAISDRSLESEGPLSSFTVKIATASQQTPQLEVWKSELGHNSEAASYNSAKDRTTRYWHSYWERSHFDCSEPSIARGYNLQRYVQACQGRGAYPIKFNGGYYTVEPAAMGKPFNPDWRAWGDAHWFQNVRHMQHPMLTSGDFEMMDPFFKLYESNRELAESRTALYHNAAGAYFPETMTDFGTYSGGDYGWDRTGLAPKDVQSPWWRFAWNQGPELVALMLDRWDYTRDKSFLKSRALPMAESVLRYFDTRFGKDADGRIVLDPAQSVETYWKGVVNDMPTTAGLIAITERLDALPAELKSPAQAKFFAHMKASCPALPLQTKSGTEELAPAQQYSPETSNVENPELYAIWPFRVVCLQQPKLLAEGRAAYQNRLFHQDVGWGYDGNAAALLGLTDEAARILYKKCQNSNPKYRWPATWGPTFDWLPDQNHGGNLLETTDLMLVQSESLEQGGKILLLPSWPQKWDVSFKLHAPGNTTVECATKDGKIIHLKVTPSRRLPDVVVPAQWK